MPTLEEQCLFIRTMFMSLISMVQPPIGFQLSAASIVYITQHFQARGYQFVLHFFKFLLLDKTWIYCIENISEAHLNILTKGEACLLTREQVKHALNIYLWKIEFE
jgi:hypothetical protein